jgi:hypothetical protein
MAKKFTSYSNSAFVGTVVGADLLDRVAEYINDNLRPEDIFEDVELEEWATDNGFVKPE